MRNHDLNSGAWWRGAALVSALGLSVACDFDPGDGDASGDGSGDESGDSDSVGNSGPASAGSTGQGSGEGSHTGIDPSASVTTNEPTTDSGGSEETGTGDPPGTCDELQVVCATFSGAELVLFQLDTGAIDDTLVMPFSAYDSHSITWVGENVYACAGEPQTLHEINVSTGTVVDSGLVCSGVSDVPGSLLVRRGSPEDFFGIDYAYYDDFAAVLAGAPSSVTSYAPNIDRITATADTLISTWHSDDHFSQYELSTGAFLGDIALEGHDDWNMGMDVVEGQLVVSTWFSEPMRHVAFDLATGMRTCEFPSVGAPLDLVDGLACRRSDDAPPPQPPPG